MFVEYLYYPLHARCQALVDRTDMSSAATGLRPNRSELAERPTLLSPKSLTLTLINAGRAVHFGTCTALIATNRITCNQLLLGGNFVIILLHLQGRNGESNPIILLEVIKITPNRSYFPLPFLMAPFLSTSFLPRNHRTKPRREGWFTKIGGLRSILYTALKTRFPTDRKMCRLNM